jgi:predicted metal-dependent phosphotriesterase family hydrolase
VRKSVLLPVALLSATLGVSDKDIDAMLVGNPRKLFEG